MPSVRKACLFRSRLFRAKGAGLRVGGLTGRRAVALAALLLCSAVAQANGTVVPCGNSG